MRAPLYLLAAFLSLAAAQTKTAFDKPTFEEYVRRLFVWGPQIQVKIDDPKPAPIPGFSEVSVNATAGQASDTQVFYVSKDGQKVIRGMVFDIAKSPFQSDLDKLKTEFQPSFGTPGAQVVIVMFSDFQCGFCREEAQMLRKNLLASYPNEVRVYFKDYPLDAIHPWARPASIAGRCVFRQKPTAFWEFHDWIYERQAEITPENLNAKVQEFATAAKLDPVPLNACIASKATEAEVNRNVAEGRALGINSTPTLFVNGRKLVGQMQWPQLQQIIDYEVGYQKKHGESAEKCCEVKLPSPLSNQ